MKDFTIKWWENSSADDCIGSGFIVLSYNGITEKVAVNKGDTPGDIAKRLSRVFIGDDLILGAEVKMTKDDKLVGYKIHSYRTEFDAVFTGDQKSADMLGLPSFQDNKESYDIVSSAFKSNTPERKEYFEIALMESGVTDSKKKAHALDEVLIAADLLKERSDASFDTCLLSASLVISSRNTHLNI